jgi:hypothetical protein
MKGFKPFFFESQIARRLSVLLLTLALLSWIGWVGVVSEGFSGIEPAGWLVVFGIPVAVYLALLAVLSLVRKATTEDLKRVLSVSVMWFFLVGMWGYIWEWQNTFSLDQYVGLFILPPIGILLGFVLWRWSFCSHESKNGFSTPHGQKFNEQPEDLEISSLSRADVIGGSSEFKSKRHYICLLLMSYMLLAVVRFIQQQIPDTLIELAAFFGGGMGIAFIPLIVMRFGGNVIGWIIFAVFSIGFVQSELNLFR